MTNEPNTAAIEAAIKFHEAYERLAPQFGYETRPETKRFDPDSPNGKLMIAVMKDVGYEAAKAAEWVKVSDGLPKKDGYYELTFRYAHDRDTREIRKRFIDREFRENCRPEYLAWREINNEPYTGE